MQRHELKTGRKALCSGRMADSVEAAGANKLGPAH